MVITHQYYVVVSVQLLLSNSSHFLATLTNVPSTQSLSKRVRLWIQLKFWVAISGKQARFRSSEGRLWNEFYKQTVILYDKSQGSIAKHAAFVDSVVHIRCVWLSTLVLAACIAMYDDHPPLCKVYTEKNLTGNKTRSSGNYAIYQKMDCL